MAGLREPDSFVAQASTYECLPPPISSKLRKIEVMKMAGVCKYVIVELRKWSDGKSSSWVIPKKWSDGDLSSQVIPKK